MAKLRFFGPNPSIKGFPSYETSSFNNLPPARIVREIIQNSLDAAEQANQERAFVRFRVDAVCSKQIPDFKGYRKTFNKAVKFWEGRSNDGKLADTAQQIVDRIRDALKSLDKGKALLLSVLDNGIGLDSRRMHSMLSDAASDKKPGQSGSYGVGHLAPMALSDIRYMLYGGLIQNGQRIACGRVILASHLDRRGLISAEGFLIKDFITNSRNGEVYDFLDEDSHPKLITDRLDEIKREWGHGCVIMIPAFNNFRDRKESLWKIVSKVVAYNFSSAICRDKLVIEVCESGSKRKLDRDFLPQIIEQNKDRKRSSKGLRPSGQNAYSMYETLSKGHMHRLDTDFGTVQVNLYYPSPTGQSRVDLCRNGMWITDDIRGLRKADFADRQPFHAVIEIWGKDDSELHRLVRKAEGPMHDELSFKLLSPSERQHLKKALDSIAHFVKGQVPPLETEEYTVDDFLVVHTSPDGKTGSLSFEFWGKPTPVLRRINRQLVEGMETVEVNPPEPKPKPEPPDPPPPRPPKPRPLRQAGLLPFRSVVVPDGIGKIAASISSESDFSEVLLVLRVDENTDPTCDRIWEDEDVTISSIAIDSSDGTIAMPSYEIIPNGQAVRIRAIKAKVDYNIHIEYNAPQHLTSMVEMPVFSLELYRSPDTQKIERPKDGEELQNANRD